MEALFFCGWSFDKEEKILGKQTSVYKDMLYAGALEFLKKKMLFCLISLKSKNNTCIGQNILIERN